MAAAAEREAVAAAEAAGVAAAAEREAMVAASCTPQSTFYLFNRFCVPSSTIFLLFPLLLPLLKVT